MQSIRVIFFILLIFGFTFSGYVGAATLDTKGTGVAINCSNKPYMENHSISADGKSTIKFHGQCYYSQGENAWNKAYYITATWDGSQARESVIIPGENKTGLVLSACPSNPWLNNVSCQKKSFSGNAFNDYQITGTTVYPITANALSDAQKAQLRTELEKKKQEAACANPVLVSPSPATGGLFHPPAGIKIEVRHNPSNPPKEWTFSWAPTPKKGEWPTAPVIQNVTLSNLKTVNGVTTGIFNTSKTGDWKIQWKVDLPPYCNKGAYAAMWTNFTVKEKSQAETMTEKAIKAKQSTVPDTKVVPGKPGVDPIDQQKMQQQKLQQQQKQLQQQQKQQVGQ